MPLTREVGGFPPERFRASLNRLIQVANGESGQTRHVRRFLLGLYNGPEWPFDLTDLRCLDRELQQACLDVLAVDVLGLREIHTWLDSGEAPFKGWWEREAGALASPRSEG